MHELTHKDIGADGQQSSEEHASARKYQLHEIISYRWSLKEYANTWVIEDIQAYLKKKESITEYGNIEELRKLRDKAGALEIGVRAFRQSGILTLKGISYPYYGDKACRWETIEEEIKKLWDDIGALKFDAISRRNCRHFLTSGRRNQQIVTDADRKLIDIGKEFRAKEQTIRLLVKKISADKNRRARLSRQLKLSPLQSHRLRLAVRIAEIDRSLKHAEKRLADARRERAAIRAERKITRAERAGAQKISTNAPANYSRCRIKYIKALNLRPSLLPPDMVYAGSGKIKIVSKSKVRIIDLAEAVANIKKMFNYDAKILRDLDRTPAKDPRTPCYKPPKTKTASKKPAPSTHAKGKSWRPPARPKKAAKPKKKCKRGGLVGAVNCVTKQMDQ